MKTAFCAMVIALNLVASGAQASDWWAVESNKTAVHFMDRSSMFERLIQGKKVTEAWQQSVYRVPKNGTSMDKTLILANCANRTFGIQSTVLYRADGTVISSVFNREYQIVFEPIVPDTLGEVIFAFACTPAVRATTEDSYRENGRFFVRAPSPNDAAKAIWTILDNMEKPANASR